MNPDPSDTIAAIATAPGEASIAIVRISGPTARAVADRLFLGSRRPSAATGQSLLIGRIAEPTQEGPGTPIDEAVLLIFRAPHSYTREDVVEIQVHGGRLSARRVLGAALAAGARPAEPGEFTKRAFLNGRIDLLQAEAVADLIRAQSDRAAQLANEQLSGVISCYIEAVYEVISGLAADIEATMDFVEDELPVTTANELRARLDDARSRVQDLIAGWREGHLLRDGARVVIAGEPNVGKSTLMNRLLARERAIVSAIPGTTRDTIEELLILDGVPIRLTDTAGLRDADCLIEQEGIRRARAALEAADLTVYMVDGARPLSPADRAQLTAAAGMPFLLIINKRDLVQMVEDKDIPVSVSRERVCLLTPEDTDRVRRAITEQLQRLTGATTAHAAISERHRCVLEDVRRELDDASRVMEAPGLDGALLAAEHLRQALEALGTLNGRVYSEALLDAIFSRFCVGK